MPHYPRIASLAGVEGLRHRLLELGLDLPSDDAPLAARESPLAAPLALGRMRGREAVAPNRFAIHPMEGWDGTDDGRPSELTRRRWRNFGSSGAGWIWGGEAVAVRGDGRANPRQLWMTDANAAAIGSLREDLLTTASARGLVEPVVGLQLTHSGRWARQSQASESGATDSDDGDSWLLPPSEGVPRIAFRHPLLDGRVGIADDRALLSDDEVRQLIPCFARAAHLAQEEGFDFVDVKHCHGYLLHEFLSARGRPGSYGGPQLGDRTRLLFELVDAVRVAAPLVAIGVRLSVFDCVPHRAETRDDAGRLGPGVPEAHALPYEWGFGLDPAAPERMALDEPIALVRSLVAAGVRLINVTAGSPYYVPHVQRPAAFPPSDGYAPPEDPLAGVVRLLEAARQVKAAVPDAVVLSTGWSYLQEYIPHVAQACVREGWFDAVGLGRLALSYPDLPADVLAGRPLARKRICRTFSECTTAPRTGKVSGCYPLDPFYKAMTKRGA